MGPSIRGARFDGCVVAVAVALLLAGCGSKQDRPSAGKPAAETESKLEQSGKKAGEIATQPVRDVGVAKINIPPILVKANDDPYGLDGMQTCEQIAVEVRELNEVLGPDFQLGNRVRESRAGKLAEAGGKTIVNAIIPFRGLVREITGAGPAQRRLNAAIDAGFARRGFLRGVHQMRRCRTGF